jgi:hypothetical protein
MISSRKSVLTDHSAEQRPSVCKRLKNLELLQRSASNLSSRSFSRRKKGAKTFFGGFRNTYICFL